MPKHRIINKDCRKAMRAMEPNSVDSIVCDPPYGYNFMGKGWDHGVPGVPFWKEALRVLKPGGYLLAFGGTRTFHRLAVAIEDSGFEIRDCLSWMYGSGFPKSMDVSKAIDKEAGATRKQVGFDSSRVRPNRKYKSGALGNIGGHDAVSDRTDNGATITAPATPEAQQWEGWGTALKPAWEPIIMARKPLSEKTVAKNVLKHGTGGLNIDATRIAYQGSTDKASATPQGRTTAKSGALAGGTQNARARTDFARPEQKGRWPANVVLDREAGAMLDQQSGVSKSSGGRTANISKTSKIYGGGRGLGQDIDPQTVKGDPGFGDTGGASRFFYCAKVSKTERNAGLESLPIKRSSSTSGRRNATDMSASKTDNHVTSRFVTERQNTHPTVKPVAVMQWLVKMVTPSGGVCCDPFMGSGSTGIACVREGFSFIGIDNDKENDYIEIAKLRIRHAIKMKRGR